MFNNPRQSSNRRTMNRLRKRSKARKFFATRSSGENAKRRKNINLNFKPEIPPRMQEKCELKHCEINIRGMQKVVESKHNVRK